MLKKLVEFCVTKPATIIILAVVFLAGFAVLAVNIQQDGRIEALISPANPQIKIRNDMEAIFGSSNFILVGVAAPDGIDTTLLTLAQKVQVELESQPEVRQVHSLFNKQYLDGGGAGFEVRDIAEKDDAGNYDLQQILTRLTSDPIYQGNLISLNQRAFPLIVEFTVGTTDQIATERVEAALQKFDLTEQWVISGLPVIQHEMKRFMDRDMGLLVPLFIVAIIVLLYLSFRSLRGVLIPLAPIVVAVVATYGLMGAVGIKITMVTNLVPMLLIAIGSAYSIHFLNQYYREIQETPEKKIADIVSASGAHIGSVIFLAAVTTMIGFLSNVFNPVTAIRDFAVSLGFGVFILLTANLTLVPALLAVLKKQSTKNTGIGKGWLNTFLDRFLSGLFHFVLNYRRIAVLSSATLILISIWGVSQVKVESSGLSFFKDSSTLVQSSRTLSKNYGGVVGFDFAIDTGNADGAKQVAVINVLNELSSWLKREYPNNVKVTLSLADYIGQMAKAYTGAEHSVPLTSDDEIAQYLEVYSWGGDIEEDLRNVVDPSFRYLRFSGRFALLENPDGSYQEESLQTQKAIIDHAQQWLSEKLPAEVSVKPFGEIMIATEVNDSIIDGQLISLALAMASVLVVTMVALRSVVAGVLCLLPVIVAVFVNFGVMGVFGIPLNIATALVSTMAVGIGVDDAIHFVSTYRTQFFREQNYEFALQQTIMRSGRAIIYTTLALIGGYLIMLASSFTPVVYFGLLNIITIGFATLATLFTLSGIMIWLKPKFVTLHGSQEDAEVGPTPQPNKVNSTPELKV